MEIIGLIAEYNPLHNGHIYQIKKIKEMYPNSLIVLILNGYFTERGEISYLTKEIKTKYALDYGIDIVIGLPSIYGTQAADVFAETSLYLLNQLHITKLVFGSESANIPLLKEIANKELEPAFNEELKNYLSKGYNYPTSLAKCLKIKDFNYLPNDLLGISYLKAINKINKQIEPIAIKRTNDYHDLLSDDTVISAENIRHRLNKQEDVSKYTPVKEFTIPNYNEYFKLLKLSIINNDLSNILDASEGLDKRLKKYINQANNLTDFIKLVKTKRYTYNRLNRLFIHILLNINLNNKDTKLTYIPLLGFNKQGKKYLNKLNLNFKPSYEERAQELKAALIYDLINNTNTYLYEIKNKPIIK
jgi:predicted nucleotidyltransferase